MRLWLLISILFVGCGVDYPEPVPEPTPIVVPEPVPDLSDKQKEWVSGVMSYKDDELSEFYATFADIVSRDSEIINTTGSIREAHVKAGKLMFQKRRESNPELANAVDAAFKKALGLQNVALTEDKREEVVLFLEAMAWAFK